MSEKLDQSPERFNQTPDASAESEQNLKRLEKAAEEAALSEKEEIGIIEQQAKAEAVSGAEVTVGENESTRNDTPPYSHKELKDTAYRRGLERVRSNLSAPDRIFSKVIHAKPVDGFSNAAAKTVARPSGFLGGALVTLAGSLILTYMTRHYGYRYNYLFFVFLFFGGYLAGLILEAAMRLFRRR